MKRISQVKNGWVKVVRRLEQKRNVEAKSLLQSAGRSNHDFLNKLKKSNTIACHPD